MRKRQSDETRKSVTDAVTAVLATVGAGRLTHRRVALAAGRALSVTSYHFGSRDEMLAAAARALLESYLSGFRNLTDGIRAGAPAPAGLAELEARLVSRAAGRNRVAALAWYEIMLTAARAPGGQQMAARWFDELTLAWQDLSAVAGFAATADRIAIAIDRIVGMQLIVLALGLDEAPVTAALRGGDPLALWDLGGTPAPAPADPTTGGARSQILDAAIRLLVRDGAGGLTYRALAAEAGLALSAPAYHFGSIAGVLAAAQAKLFRAAKARYRSGAANLGAQPASLALLTESTAAIFRREATDFGLFSIAHYSVWAEAARNEALRAEVRLAVLDQIAAWQRRLAGFAPVAPTAALQLQAQFIGRLIRLLATGCRPADLASTEQQFTAALLLATQNQDNFSNFL